LLRHQITNLPSDRMRSVRAKLYGIGPHRMEGTTGPAVSAPRCAPPTPINEAA